LERFVALAPFLGSYGTFYLPNHPCHHAQRAICRDFIQPGVGPTARNLFAGTVTLRNATSL
jgi:hypothetical protein